MARDFHATTNPEVVLERSARETCFELGHAGAGVLHSSLPGPLWHLRVFLLRQAGSTRPGGGRHQPNQVLAYFRYHSEPQKSMLHRAAVSR